METTARRVNYIASHFRHHFDEGLAIWELRRFGRKMFPGVEEAEIVIWDAGSTTPDGRSTEEYEADGWLLVGVGGSRFDEHASAGNGRREGECAATLVAKELGVEGDPALKRILKFALRGDTKAASHPFDLARVMWVLHRQYPDNPLFVQAWLEAALDAKYAEHQGFLRAIKDFREKARTREIVLDDGRKVLLVVIESDEEDVWKAARWMVKAAVGIIRRSNGNVVVLTDQALNLDLAHTAGLIRLAEQWRKYGNNPVVRPSERARLQAEGTVPGIEEWHYFLLGKSLFNGSLTTPNMPPTRIPLDEIERLVVRGLTRSTS